MFISKKVAPFVVLTSLLTAGNAMAAEGTTVTFEALIRAASCDVTSSNEGSRVDWGVFTTDQATAAGVGGPLGEDKQFNLNLSNCGFASAEDEDAVISVYAKGNQAAFDSELFANAAAKTLAVQLVAGKDDTKLLPNQETDVTITGAVAQDGNAVIPVTASLIVTNLGEVDTLNVPVTFTVAYN